MNFRESYKRFFSHLRKARHTKVMFATLYAIPLIYASSKKDFIFISFASLVSGFCPAIWIYATAVIINKLALPPPIDLLDINGSLILWAVAFILPRILSPIIQFYQVNLADNFTAFINIKIIDRSSEFKSILHLDDSEFFNMIENIEAGANSRPVNLVAMLFYIVKDVVTVASICILLMSVAWWMPLLFLTALYPGIFASIHFRQLMWNTVLDQSTDARKMNYFSHLSLDPIYSIELRVYQYYGWLKERYIILFESLRKERYKVRRKTIIGELLIEIFSLGCTSFIIYWCIYQVSLGNLTIGVIAAIIQALFVGHAALFSVVESIAIVFERGLFFCLYFKFMDIENTFPLGGSDVPKDLCSLKFNNVSFTYNNGTQALTDVSFEINKGESVAIVGTNGSGKSTLIKLLLRLYDPYEGAITLEDKNLKEIDVDKWRKKLGIVTQNICKYSLTLKENINISNLEKFDYEDNDLMESLNIVGLEDLYKSYGIGAQLGKEFDGHELSGGQWQKLSIARAIFRDSEILIMDEPSAALDPESEAEFFEHMQALAKDKIAIFVTHRLGSARFADKIIVMRGSQIAEIGTHEQLITNDDEYANLWNRQSDAYQSTQVP